MGGGCGDGKQYFKMVLHKQNKQCECRMDGRGWTIVAVTALCIIATAVTWWMGLGHDPSTPFGAIFSSWTAGLSLFVITGILVAVFSLTRPEGESFDARARILFKKQSGKHIDHIVESIKNALEHYTEEASIKIIILSKHDPESKFRISCEAESKIKSYIDDATCTFPSKFKLTEINSSPLDNYPNRIVYLRINDIPQEDAQCSFVDEYEYEYDLTIDSFGLCKLERCSEIWIDCDTEENKHIPNRYTKSLNLSFENRLASNVDLRVKFSRNGGAKWDDLVLASGQTRTALRVADAPPNKEIYRYRVSVI